MNECIANLKQLYPGVHGKISDLCTIPQQNYHLAVTIILGKK